LELVSGIVIAPQRPTALLAKQAAEVDIVVKGSGSTVGEGAKSRANQVATGRPEAAQSDREQTFGDGGHVVEGGNTVMVDPFVWPNGNAGRDASNRPGDGCHDDVVENRYRLVARHDKDRPVLEIRRLQEPELSLSYQGSASVMAIAFAKAS
jgi:hypothetical protein